MYRIRRTVLAFLMTAGMLFSAAAYDTTVPAAASAFKSYMGYTAITARGSTAYRLQHSGQAYTGADGLRMYRDNEGTFYMVAVGSYYGKTGDKLTVTMENGTVFHAIIGDQKANAHTDSTNRYHLSDRSVIEFIVDNSALNRRIRAMGDASYAASLNLTGRVQSIQPYTAQAQSSAMAGKNGVSVVLSNVAVNVNGLEQTVAACKIAGNNYVKLRDAAALLNGTDGQFDVYWDGESANLTAGQPYTTIGGELQAGDDAAHAAEKAKADICFKGASSEELAVYRIEGSSYVKLRDLGSMIGFEVDWDSNANKILVNA